VGESGYGVPQPPCPNERRELGGNKQELHDGEGTAMLRTDCRSDPLVDLIRPIGESRTSLVDKSRRHSSRGATHRSRWLLGVSRSRDTLAPSVQASRESARTHQAGVSNSPTDATVRSRIHLQQGAHT
jgi:hypothetical protein